MFRLGTVASSSGGDVIFEGTGNATYVAPVVGEYVTTPDQRYVGDTDYNMLNGTEYLVSGSFQLNSRETNFVYYRDRAGGFDTHFLVLADLEGGTTGGYTGFPANSGWTTVTVTNNTTSATVTHSRSSATFGGANATLQDASGSHSAGAWSWANITDTLPTTDNTDSITITIE